MKQKNMNDLFTDAAREVIARSIEIAQKQHHAALVPLHTLAAGLEHEFVQSLFAAFQVSQEQLTTLAQRDLEKLPSVQGNVTLTADPLFERFVQALQELAKQMDDEYVSLEHFVLVWLQDHFLPSDISALFKNAGCSFNQMASYIQTMRKGKTVKDKRTEQQYNVLEKFCTNITKQARDGVLDPVIGRHEEIRRVMQILSRRTKNNPVLIGEPGVGKTAIAEGIAQRIVSNDVPDSLKNKTIFGLDLGLLIAGTKYQGEFEERLKNLLKEIEESSDDIILFIDELHMLIGAGSAGGGMDASNLLKPALARGLLHCIGATTLKEYKKYIEKDAALERRFQKVLVEEPTPEDAVSILRGLKDRFELHHGISIKDQALVDAVNLSVRYIADRFLPDKAIDLIDEAAAMVKMSIDSQPEMIDQLARKIRQLEIEKVAIAKEKDDPAAKTRLQELEKELAELKEKNASLLAQWKAEKEPLARINKLHEEIEHANYQFILAEREGNYAKASEIKYGTIVQLEQKLHAQQERLKELKPTLIKQQVDERDVAKVLARWTGIPAERLETTESEKLLRLADLLRERIVGQDEAVEQVAAAIQLHRTGLTDPKKPIGSFFFLGPTGVGKTEVAKALAELLFNDEKKMIRIDMSEYMEKHAVARLIGAPPGYVGYEEGGQLTEQVRRHPYCVLLFDEVEKAHPDVFNIFLQILDEGHLTDGQGRVVSFRNCIIIMTSNIGSDIILESPEITEKVRESVERLLQKTFRPEFLNRIDAIIFFHQLQPVDVEQIAQLRVTELIKRLEAQHITLSVDKKVIAHLAELGYEKEFGARPLKRVIYKHLAVPIAQLRLKHPEQQIVNAKMKDDEIVIS